MYMTYGQWQCNEIYTLQDSKVAYKTRTLTLRLTSNLKASPNPRLTLAIKLNSNPKIKSIP